MSTLDHVWKSPAVGKQFLEGVRGAIPFASQQIELVVFLLEHSGAEIVSFLDLGCGDGVLGRALLAKWPEAKGVFLDFSETMIAAAKRKLESAPHQSSFLVQDYGQPEWVRSVTDKAPFDAVISGFSIHHQPDERKQAIYREVFELLSPGGWFLNLEHVASASPAVGRIFDAYFIEALCQYHQRLGTAKTREEIASEYCHRPDKASNILAPVEEQCQWLNRIGFADVDCYFKILELALFGGKKPDSYSA